MVIPCVSAPDTNQFQQRSRRILTLRSKPSDLGHKIKTEYKIKTYRIVGKKQLKSRASTEIQEDKQPRDKQPRDRG